MKKKMKYLYKAGDWTALYPINEEVAFLGKNWKSNRWRAVDTYYNPLKDRTTIKLEKICG